MATGILKAKQVASVLRKTVESIVSAAFRLSARSGHTAEDIRLLPEVVSDLRKEVESLQVFVGDAEHRFDEDLMVRKWISKIGDLIYEAEEITDKHLDRIRRHRRQHHRSGRAIPSILYLLGDVLLITPLLNGLAIRREASKIYSLTEKISLITSQLKAHGIDYKATDSTATADPDPEESLSKRVDQDESIIIGLNDDIKAIENQLVCEKDTKVVGICGVNGLGKTSLAKEVFKRQRAAGHFDAIAWAFVGPQSQESVGGHESRQPQVGQGSPELRLVVPEIEELQEGQTSQEIFRTILLDLLGNVDEEEKRRTRDGSVRDDQWSVKLSQILKEKRCLVILDDIQTPATWDHLKSAFSSIHSDNSTSKLLLTTCDPQVLSYIPQAFLHQLRFLNSEEIWELFLKIVGSSGKGVGGLRLELIAKPVIQDLIRIGIPLTIHVLGGLWKSHPSVFLFRIHMIDWIRWRPCGDQSILELEVEDVLSVTDASLPHRLRKCLLEMLSYPEGFQIPTDDLFKVWINKGITKRLLTAKRCLHELVDTSLIQVERNNSGKIGSCQLHSVVRDFYMKLQQKPSWTFYQALQSIRNYGLRKGNGNGLVLL